MCSPARHPGAAYQAVSSRTHVRSCLIADIGSQYGHSSVVNPLGDVVAEADETEAIVYADIGGSTLAVTGLLC